VAAMIASGQLPCQTGLPDQVKASLNFVFILPTL